MKIIGSDNLGRESVADRLLLAYVPQWAEQHAQAACDALNQFTCTNNDGTFYHIVKDDYRLCRGIEDLV